MIRNRIATRETDELLRRIDRDLNSPRIMEEPEEKREARQQMTELMGLMGLILD